MKSIAKGFLIIVSSLLIVVVVFLVLIFANMRSNIVIDIIASPDGEYNAILFRSNGGATTAFGYELSVYKDGRNISNWSRANVYSSDFPFEVIWTENKILYVENTPITAYKQRTFVNGVTIQYKYNS